jgi:hypothetical protein
MSNLIDRASARNSSPCLFRTRLVPAGWVVVRRTDGFRTSIPTYIRRRVPLVNRQHGEVRHV